MKRLMLILAFAVAPATTAFAHDYVVYRALRGLTRVQPPPDFPCVSGPEVTEGTFRIDADGLSTFQTGTPLRHTDAYRVGFVVTNVSGHQLQQGDAGQVQQMPNWFGTFTPQHGGAGHWSLVTCPRISNNAMKRALVAYATNAGNVSRNPSYAAGTIGPQYCPDAP